MPSHNILTDPEIHEPKDVSTANISEVYIADGAGSGAWADVPEQLPTGTAAATVGQIFIADGAASGAFAAVPESLPTGTAAANAGEVFIADGAASGSFAAPAETLPTGTAAAAAGEIFVADGAAGGAFEQAPARIYGGMYSDNSSIAVGTIGTTKKLLPAFDADMPANGTTPAHASDNITIPTAGVYLINFNVSFATLAVGDAGIYHIHARLDAVEVPQLGTSHEFTGANDHAALSCSGIATVTAGQILTLYIESDEAGDTDDVIVEDAQLTVTLLKEA